MNKKGQISIEIIILLGIIIVGAVIVSIFLIQNANRSRDLVSNDNNISSDEEKVFNEINDPEKVSGPIGVILEKTNSKNTVVFRKSGLYTWSVFLK